MGRRFSILRDYYEDDKFIYDKSSVTLQPGLTVLVGCNGSGKTTLLHQIEHKCKADNIPVLSYDNLKQGGENARQKYLLHGLIDDLLSNTISSEGERIVQNFSQQAREIGAFVQQHKQEKELFVLIDAIDSGMSVDNIVELKQQFLYFVIDDCKKLGIDMYFIISANEYELCRGENCLNVQTLKYRKIKSYETYRKLIINSRRKKNVRYGWGDFEYE